MESPRPGRRAPRSWRPELIRLEDRLTPAVDPGSGLHPYSIFSPDQYSTPNGLFLTPDQIRHGYGVDAIPAFGGTITADGAGQTIAIVDYGYDPNIASDLAAFDTYFGTPENQLDSRPVASFFSQVGQTGGAPLTDVSQQDPGWIGEICLDVEWAHAIAPKANILLVDCDLNDPDGLYTGDKWAAAQPGVSVVSNSWGQDEYFGEKSDDATFVTPAGHQGVTFVFAAGDYGTTSYPAASPNVLSVGGTNLTLGAGSKYIKETGWTYDTPDFGSGGGGGTSVYESRPSFQAGVVGVARVVGQFRGTPDVAYNGGPDSEVWVYDSFNNGTTTPWDGAFGTSAGAPQWAGLVALIDQGRAAAGLTSLDGQTQTLKDLYSLPTTDFHDVKSGRNEYGQAAMTGYDLLTGLGSPVADKLVPDMVGASKTTVAASPSFLPSGGSVTLTATVAGPTGVPSGTVDFKFGAVDLGSATLSGGTATLLVSGLPDGTDTITANYSGDTTYPTSSGTTTVTVGMATASLSLAPAQGSSPVYGQQLTLVGTVTGLPGFVPSGTLDFTFGGTDLGQATLSGGTATLITDFAFPAGPDAIVMTYSGDGSYLPGSGTGTLTVAAAPLSVTPAPQTMTYGGTLPDLAFKVSGFVNGDTPGLIAGDLATTAGPASPVGTYAITQGTLDAGPNYIITVAPASVSVLPAVLTVTALPKSVSYGGPAADLTDGYSTRGFVNGDTAAVLTGALATDALPASPVGTYAITQGTLDAGKNYTIQFTGAAVTVTPAVLTITPDPKTVQYGTGLPALTYSYSGLANGDTSGVLSGALSTTVTARSGVGSYPIAQGTLAAGANYTVRLVPAVLTVTPAPLTVTANDRTAPNDGPVTGLTYSVSGLVNGDSPKVVSGVTLSTPVTTSSPAGQYPITVTAGNLANYTVTTKPGTLTLVPSPSLIGSTRYAVGTNSGGDGSVTVYNADGSVATTVDPFPGYTGPVRSAVADFNGDGTPDLIVGAGPGIPAEVKIFDGSTQQLIYDVRPFGDFTGGVYVAAGDIAGDGTAELAVTPDQGGGPRVTLYHTGSINPVANFFGIADPNFRGGARVAVGDLNHDGHADLVVAAGFGGGSRVSVYDGAALAQGRLVHPVGDFLAFADNLRNGTYVAVGDVDGDGNADLIVGGGPGGGPRVLVLSGQKLWAQGSIAALASPIANFFAGDAANRDGVPVAAKNLDGSGQADIVVGDGGGGSTVAAYSGASTAEGNPALVDFFDALPGYTGGVFVG